jgi:hypothetical protein
MQTALEVLVKINCVEAALVLLLEATRLAGVWKTGPGAVPHAKMNDADHPIQSGFVAMPSRWGVAASCDTWVQMTVTAKLKAAQPYRGMSPHLLC